MRTPWPRRPRCSGPREPDVRPRIGVDLGGTKIEAVALGPGGQEDVRRRVPTPRDDYAGTLGAIAGLVESVEEEVGGPSVVGIGMPGAISRVTGLVKNSNSV